MRDLPIYLILVSTFPMQSDEYPKLLNG